MVTLRSLSERDGPWLDAWLGGVARSVGYHPVDADAPASSFRSYLHRERNVHARVIQRDGDAGLLVYRLLARKKSAVIEFIGTPPERARRGVGLTAAALVEDELRSAGARTLYAPAPDRHGIDVYFWIRLGYRPLLRAEWPCAVDRVAWLRRDLG